MKTYLLHKPRIGLNIKYIITYLAIIAIFTEAITFKFFIFSWFKVYNLILAAVLILLFFSLKKIYLNKTFLLAFFVIVYFSLLNILMDNNSMRAFLPQAIAIFIHSSVFYVLIKLNEKDVQRIFKTYLNVAFITGLIGLSQIVFYYVYKGVAYLWRIQLISEAAMHVALKYLALFFEYHWFLPNWQAIFSHCGLKVNSIMPEPASFCIIMIPAFFAAFVSFIRNNVEFMSKIKSCIIILSCMLSFSLLSYMAFFLIIGLLLFSYLKLRHSIVLFCLIIILCGLFFYHTLKDVEIRIVETYEVLKNKLELQKANQSTYTFLLNAKVAFYAFEKNYLFGNGLGSNETSYNEYTAKNKIVKPQSMSLLNQKDANSLFLRLLSETGLLGFIMFFIFIYKNFIYRKKDITNYLWVINNAILVLFIIRLIRQGNYISEGFFFFFWLYYFTKKNMQESR